MQIDWLRLLMLTSITVSIGVVIYHVVAGFYHYKYYVRRAGNPETWKIQPKRFIKPAMHRNSIMVGTANLVLGGLVTGILVYAIENGLPTQLYFDVNEMGWAYTLISPIIYFVVVDASAYYVHRLFHQRWLFRRFHRYHHKFVATTPYAAVAIHPVELAAQQAAAFALIFIMPLHPAVIGCVLVYILVFNVIDHSGVELPSMWPWQAPTNYHDDHHVHFHVNFGQHLMLWDRLHNTLRRERRTYGKDVFGGRGLANPDDPGENPFVDYKGMHRT